MKNDPLRVWFLLAVLALPARAFAQPGSSAEQPFRKWDAAGGFGFAGGVADPAVPVGEYGAELGRYWTEHVRTSLALSNTGRTSYPSYSDFPEGFTSTQASARHPLVVSGLVAYQFLENAFVHPYVSAGIRLAWLSDTRDTYSTSPPYHTRTSPARLDARPVVGAGFKTYFASGRAFLRPEFLVVVDPRGAPHGIARMVAGVDF
jgi:hypothetical protein